MLLLLLLLLLHAYWLPHHQSNLNFPSPVPVTRNPVIRQGPLHHIYLLPPMVFVQLHGHRCGFEIDSPVCRVR